MMSLSQAYSINMGATLDKASVRSEVSRLKKDFENLCAEGKVTGESQAIMSSLLMVVKLILAIFMERTTTKDTANSSEPSSQTEKNESVLNHAGSNGKGKPVNKAAALTSRAVESVAVSKVTICDVCGENFDRRSVRSQ